MSGKRRYDPPLREQIVRHLQTKWRGDGSTWNSFAALAIELQANIRTVKAEVHRLCRDGFVFYSQCYDEDRGFCGSGYFLTTAGEAWGEDDDGFNDVCRRLEEDANVW